MGWIPKGLLLWTAARWPRLLKGATPILNDIFWIQGVPDQPFYLGTGKNFHAGIDNLLTLMGRRGLKFYRSSKVSTRSGPSGLISASDVVLIKVNAQWKYRGCTNSDIVRGLIQKILNHPDTFKGEVVILDNGQGRGSLNCDTSAKYSDDEVHANANNEAQSFTYLEDVIFKDPRVTTFLLDPIRDTFIGGTDHVTNGYRIYENVSYPCFTTSKGNRVELKKGVWNGTSYTQNLKLINIPVLKHHDTAGAEITAAVKHMYGLVSMSDGQRDFRHYDGLGETGGKMMVSVCKPVLNIVDAIWVSHLALAGYPESMTCRSNQLLASQDPVALDYWAAKYVLYPIDNNPRHHPDFSNIDTWLTEARDLINARGGLTDAGKGIIVGKVTKNEAEMRIFAQRVTLARRADLIANWSGQGVFALDSEDGAWTKLASPADAIAAGDLDGDGLDDLIGIWPGQDGVWVKYSETGSWAKLANPARHISAGDINGDGREDLLGTWDDQGVFYRDSKTGLWVKIALPATQVIAGDLDGDGIDDLIGIWPDQDGAWVKRSRDSSWEKLASTPEWIAVGDMNADGKAEFIGSWNDLGVFYRDSASGAWVKMATPALAIATGDLDGNGKDDLVGMWPELDGVWVRYSQSGIWERLSSAADRIATGRLRKTTTGLSRGLEPLGALQRRPDGPGVLTHLEDRSAEGPGGWRFTCREETNLVPSASEPLRRTRIPGPGEPGFRYVEQGNIVPNESRGRQNSPRTRTGHSHSK